MTDTIWECECGSIEYGSAPPEECGSCFKIDSFTQLPLELIEERSKERESEEALRMQGISVRDQSAKPLKSSKTQRVKQSSKLKTKQSKRKK